MCWNVKLFVRLIFRSSRLSWLLFWKTTRVLPWNSVFSSGISSLKSMLSTARCSGMPVSLLGCAFSRLFLIFITIHLMESPRSDKDLMRFLPRVSLCTCISSLTENGVSTTFLKFVSKSVMFFTCLLLLLVLTMVFAMFSIDCWFSFFPNCVDCVFWSCNDSSQQWWQWNWQIKFRKATIKFPVSML